METSLAVRVLSGGMNLALVLALAPLFEGILRKVTARVQSRQGPPIWQPYYDLLKLLGQGGHRVRREPGDAALRVLALPGRAS